MVKPPLFSLAKKANPWDLRACPCPVQQRGPQYVILRGSVGSAMAATISLNELQAAAGIECDAIGIKEGRHLVVHLLPGGRCASRSVGGLPEACLLVLAPLHPPLLLLLLLARLLLLLLLPTAAAALREARP